MTLSSKRWGAPFWHGRNFDALNDSIGAGGINEIEVLYRLVICNYDLVGEGASKIGKRLCGLIRELAAGGVPVEVVVRR